MAFSITSAGRSPVVSEADDIVSAEWIMCHCKILPCRKRYSHDWSDCVFAHAGEKVQRRCPRKQGYHGIMCPDIKKIGMCPRGDVCCYAHNSFEYWLHPTRYRTELCTFGPACTRPVCFFAHSTLELRSPAPIMSPIQMTSEHLDHYLHLDMLETLQTPSPTFNGETGLPDEEAAWAPANISQLTSQVLPATFSHHGPASNRPPSYQRPHQRQYSPVSTGAATQYGPQHGATYSATPNYVQGLPPPSAPHFPRSIADKPEPFWSQTYASPKPPHLGPRSSFGVPQRPAAPAHMYGIPQGLQASQQAYPTQASSRMWATDSPYISTTMMSHQLEAAPTYSTQPASHQQSLRYQQYQAR